MSALVVSIWLVASMSSTSARVSGAASTWERTTSWIGAAVTQKIGASTRSTRTPGNVRRSSWFRMPPHAAFSCGTFPITSTSTRLDR